MTSIGPQLDEFATWLAQRPKPLGERSRQEAVRIARLLKTRAVIHAESGARYVNLRWVAKLWQDFCGEQLPVPQPTMLHKGRMQSAVSMPDEDWAKLYAALTPQDDAAAAVLRVMMVTAKRVGDVLRIPLDALRAALARSDGLVEYRVKGGKAKKATISDDTRGDWERLLAASAHAGTVPLAVAPKGDGSPEAGHAAYQTVNRTLRRTAATLKLTGRPHLHRLRRTVLVQVLRAGEDITVARDLADHASIVTTQKYADEAIAGHAARGQAAIAQFRKGKV